MGAGRTMDRGWPVLSADSDFEIFLVVKSRALMDFGRTPVLPRMIGAADFRVKARWQKTRNRMFGASHRELAATAAL